MSDVFYPISLVQAVDVQRADRTLMDEFESGSVATRRYWSAYNFKRRVALQHSPMTLSELRTLRTFHAQRSGQSDSFWFRDNVNRGGNIKVRFKGDLSQPWQAGARQIAVQLEEVAPVRALPELDEVTAAAGSAPVIWYDANRELYLPHNGTVYTENAYEAVAMAADAPWQAGSLPLGNALTQYQHYAFDGTAWAKGQANVSGITALKAACTLLAMVKHSTSATQQLIFGIGTGSTASGMGIQLNASNEYTPWIGSFGTWSTAKQSNGTSDTWRSLAVTWASGSNTGTLFTNGTSIGGDSNTRSFFPGPVSLGAAPDGTLLTTGNVAHVMAFASVLSTAQIKAVHNLLGYQYGLATV